MKILEEEIKNEQNERDEERKKKTTKPQKFYLR